MYCSRALQSFAYICGTIWTMQHLTFTLTFKDHWPHDLHDFAERIPTNIKPRLKIVR